jgi:hypothetical protein
MVWISLMDPTEYKVVARYLAYHGGLPSVCLMRLRDRTSAEYRDVVQKAQNSQKPLDSRVPHTSSYLAIAQ